MTDQRRENRPLLLVIDLCSQVISNVFLRQD